MIGYAYGLTAVNFYTYVDDSNIELFLEIMDNVLHSREAQKFMTVEFQIIEDLISKILKVVGRDVMYIDDNGDKKVAKVSDGAGAVLKRMKENITKYNYFSLGIGSSVSKLDNQSNTNYIMQDPNNFTLLKHKFITKELAEIKNYTVRCLLSSSASSSSREVRTNLEESTKRLQDFYERISNADSNDAGNILKILTNKINSNEFDTNTVAVELVNLFGLYGLTDLSLLNIINSNVEGLLKSSATIDTTDIDVKVNYEVDLTLYKTLSECYEGIGQ